MEGEASEVDLFSTKFTFVVTAPESCFALGIGAEPSDFFAGRTLDVGVFLLEVVEQGFELLISVAVTANIHLNNKY